MSENAQVAWNIFSDPAECAPPPLELTNQETPYTVIQCNICWGRNFVPNLSQIVQKFVNCAENRSQYGILHGEFEFDIEKVLRLHPIEISGHRFGRLGYWDTDSSDFGTI